MTDSPRFTPNVPRTIDMLSFTNFQLLDVTGPVQVFASANALAEEQNLPPPYRIRVIAGTPRIISSAGLELVAESLPDVRSPCDTLLISGGRGVFAAAEDAALTAWLGQRARHARRVVSICTGAFLLAATGLLDGRRAVTHWSHCAALARQYPAVRVETDPIFIEDRGIWTSAGVTAGIDLALGLVEQDLGRDIALAVARDLVVFLKRPGGQAQYSAALELQYRQDRFDELHGWMRGNLGENLSIPVLAARANMSERSFQRHYREATGMPPARAVERLRVEQARLLLADTALPLKRIATECGFGSEETLRRSFARQLATTPQAYRERFPNR